MESKTLGAFESTRLRLSGRAARRSANLAVLAVAVMTLQACATIAGAQQESAPAQALTVKFEDAEGPVSAAIGEAIFDKLEGKAGSSDVLQKHLAHEQAINADSPLVLGNKLTLLQNGPETYKAMFAAIRAARNNINMETFIFDDDDVGRQFSELLLEKQASGVQVNLIYDSVGGMSTPRAFYDRLRAGGINVLEFNPINPLAGNKKEWLLNNRDHRKQLIVDGRIAFTGGINISDTYSSAPSGKLLRKKPKETEPKEGWRDTHVRMEGPVVAEFQKMFMDTWARQKGEPLAPKRYFPKLKTQGDEVVRAIGSRSDDPQNLIFQTLISAINHAEREVHLTIAYFAPDSQLLTALTDAAKRGVEVKLVLPSYSDTWAIFHLGRSYYTELLRNGVKIYERDGAVMHAKTACIDGVWSTIGSTNLDWRSLLHNDEINAVILGHGFADQMEVMFADDLKQSEEINLQRWKHRSWLLRMKEQTARIGAYWL